MLFLLIFGIFNSMIMKYEDDPKKGKMKGKMKVKKAARKIGKAARKGALAAIVGSAAMKAKKKDAYSAFGDGNPKPMTKSDKKQARKAKPMPESSRIKPSPNDEGGVSNPPKRGKYKKRYRADKKK
jgi:hypothetical protein